MAHTCITHTGANGDYPAEHAHSHYRTIDCIITTSSLNAFGSAYFPNPAMRLRSIQNLIMTFAGTFGSCR